METSIVTNEDMNYLSKQTTGDLNMIISGMTVLLSDNDEKISMLESQTWFQRMVRTLTGKNKMTRQEIQVNHGKINMYIVQALTKMYELNCIDHEIMLSLANRINELYAEHLQLKQMLGAFAVKLNEKIESIDKFHLLITEIEHGLYSCSKNTVLVILCKIIAQLDKRSIADDRKKDILFRTMEDTGLLDESKKPLRNYLLQIINIPIDEIGSIYLEVETFQENYIAQLISKVIQNYHFLDDMMRKLKNKESVVDNIMKIESLDNEIKLSTKDIFYSFIESKQNAISALALKEENFELLHKAETLFLQFNLKDAFEIFESLAKNGNGRAMYFLGEYYAKGFGNVPKDIQLSKEWRIKGKDAGDVLAKLNSAYDMEDQSIANKIFEEVYKEVFKMAENGDVFAQNELSDLYSFGYGCEKNIEKAKDLLVSSANSGYWWASYKLGLAYKTGRLGEGDKTKAAEWFKKAIDQGYESAKKQLNECLPIEQRELSQETYDAIETQCNLFITMHDTFGYGGGEYLPYMTSKLNKGLSGVVYGKVYLAHDDTVFKSGKNGFVIADDGIYCREILATGITYVPYYILAQIKRIYIDGAFIYADNYILATVTGLSDEGKRKLCDIFNMLKTYVAMDLL